MNIIHINESPETDQLTRPIDNWSVTDQLLLQSEQWADIIDHREKTDQQLISSDLFMG